MLRISKLSDYGMLVMAYLATHTTQAYNAKDIAQHTHIALPTVSKLLKLLARYGLLMAQRGAKGGYILAMSAENISIAQIINAVEGNFALTECSQSKGLCVVETHCSLRHNWQKISHVLYNALDNISLAEMNKPLKATYVKNHINLQLDKHL